MCFTIHTSYSEPLIAEQDIKCYKNLSHYPKGDIYSPYRSEQYFSKKNKVSFTIKEVDYFYIDTSFILSYISEGLHSYSTSQRAKQDLDKWDKTHLAIIPKGTKYYYNPEDNEYVSLKLKVYKSTPIINLLHRILSVKLFK